MALTSKRNLSLNKKVIYVNTIVAKCFFQVIYKSHKYIMRSDSGAWGIKWTQTKLSISSRSKKRTRKLYMIIILCKKTYLNNAL